MPYSNEKQHPLRDRLEFKEFTQEEFDFLERNMRFRTFPKGQVLFNEEDPKHTLYYITSGLVTLERYDTSGDYLYVDYVKSGRLFPYSDIFSGDTYSYLASALTNIEVYALPFSSFEDILSKNNKQLLIFYKKMAEILKEQESRIQFLVVSSAHARIVKSIGYLMNELGREEGDSISVPYPITIGEISVLSGASRETVGQKIKAFRKEGKLEYAHKILKIKDPAYFIE